MKSTSIAFFCTFFEFFDIPVFWPILVMYFIVLTCLTMKRQIMVIFKFSIHKFLILIFQHMIKFRYIPFTTGKPRRFGKEDSGKVVNG